MFDFNSLSSLISGTGDHVVLESEWESAVGRAEQVVDENLWYSG